MHSALFSPDGNTLATSGSDGTARLRDTRAFHDLAILTDQARTIAGPSLTERERRRHVPDGVPYHRIRP